MVVLMTPMPANQAACPVRGWLTSAEIKSSHRAASRVILVMRPGLPRPTG